MALTHVQPGEVVHLQPDASASATSRTSALMKSDRFETVRLVVASGATIPEHKVAGFISLFCLEGHVVLGADREIELHRGDWIYLERGASHWVRGIEDSALLLTIFFD